MTTAHPAALPRTPDRARFVETNRSRMRVWEWGDPADPPIVCTHGAFDHGRMFDGLAPAVAELGYHVSAVDLRGHGDSGRLASGHTFEATLLDLGMWIETLDGPVGMIGHSMGGVLALQTAAVWPELIRWVVSLDGLGPPAEGFHPAPLEEQAATGWAVFRRVLERGPRVFDDLDAMAAQRAAINTRLPLVWLRHLVEHGSRRHGDGWIWKWDPLFSTGLPSGFSATWVEADLATVRVPTMVLTGAAPDMWAFPADQLAGRIGCLRDVVHHAVADAGHYLHLERPDIVFAHIRTFLLGFDR